MTYDNLILVVCDFCHESWVVIPNGMRVDGWTINVQPAGWVAEKCPTCGSDDELRYPSPPKVVAQHIRKP